MLNSNRARAGLLTAAATLFGANMASADALHVLIVEGAYFPALTHVQPGDELVFINNTTTSHTVSGPEASWTSGEIPASGSYTLTLSADTPTTFTGAAPGADAAVLEGAISFDPPPVDD